MKKMKRMIPLALLGLAALLAAACNFSGSPGLGTPGGGLDAVYTQAAQTIQAEITLTAQAGPTGTPGAENPTATGLPATGAPETGIPAVTATPLPANTAAPTFTATLPPPTPTNTLPPPTATPQPCNWADFVSDITVRDGTRFGPSASFTKTWRLQNIGTCTWNSDYDLVFFDGDDMDGDPVIPLPGTVRPGEVVDLSVNLRAPSREGNYRGLWMLRSPDGDTFGIGGGQDTAFWVEIRVVAPPVLNFPYDFTGNYCSAEWRTEEGRINCSGSSEDPDGSVIYSDNPTLETGRRENESSLWMRPNQDDDGFVSGTYPAYAVRAGDRFVADVGCLDGYPRCDITFSLDYRIGGGSSANLGTWHEVADGQITRVNVDLSALAGQNVQFILTVENNGRVSHAQGFWLVPSIRSGGEGSGGESPAARAARQTIAAHLGIDMSSTTITDTSARDWSDTCLGFEREDLLCSPTFIPGFRFMVSANSRNFEVHTSEDGSIVFFRER